MSGKYRAVSPGNKKIVASALLLGWLMFVSEVGSAAYSPDELETNAQIQWLLARLGCRFGAVDGLLHSSRGVSKTEACLEENGVAIDMDPKRMVNELNRKVSEARDQNLPIDVMEEALEGVGARTAGHNIKPSLYDRTRAAREALVNLAISDSFPFLLLGITSRDADIASWCEDVFRGDQSYRQLPQELWQIVRNQGEMSPGISRFFATLDSRERDKHTRQLIFYYLADADSPDRQVVNSHDLLADMIYTLWKKGKHSSRASYHDLKLLIGVLMDAQSNAPNTAQSRQLERAEIYEILRRFGNDIFRPLASVYAETAKNDDEARSASLIRDFLVTSKQPREAIKQIAVIMDADNEFVLARLLKVVIHTHYE